MNHIFYTLASVVVVSLVSLIGVVSLSLSKNALNKLLLVLVSVSAGTLFGGAFLHLLPEVVEEAGFSLQVSLTLLAGILVFFVLESFVHSHSHGKKVSRLDAPTHLVPLNLFADGIHNFVDGLIIAGSYFVSIPVGIATTIAVILHEVPQELADFGVLLYAGLSKTKALLFNFLSAAVAILGAIIGLVIGEASEQFAILILPFAAGGFIYIAGVNLIPELHKKCGFKDSMIHFFALVFGVAIMVALLFLE
tara:strand:- start:678 stop:1427 length:750 start_codon:yes stop_codon:yes gene_type:complete